MNSFEDRRLERVVTTYDDLSEICQKYPSSLIATTACLGGQLSNQTLLLIEAEKVGDKEGATKAHDDIVNFILFCQKLFGNDFYIECAPGCSKDQIEVNRRLLSISKCFKVPMVIGCDSHYLKKEDRYIHKAFLNSKEGDREVDAFYEYSYLQSNDEIIEHLQKSSFDELYVQEMFRNSYEIYQKIENFSLFHTQQIPEVDVINYPKKNFEYNDYPTLASLFASDDQVERYWVNQCFEGMEQKNIDWINQPEYVQRLEEEAATKKIIGNKLNTNMFMYPVTLQHYIDLIWECGSPIGAGRGSSCAGLNHYLLGVTQLDPIQWNLPWFRYMNKDRIEIADIDIDVASGRRPYIIKKIKEERRKRIDLSLDEQTKKNLGCTLVATFGTETSKSTVLTSCFKKDTVIETTEGEKKIQDIEAGDWVKTLSGYEQVLYPTTCEGVPNCFIKTKNSVNRGFYCTEDHEILTVESYRRTMGKCATNLMKQYIPELKNYSSADKIYDLFARNFREVTPVWKPAIQIEPKHDYGLTLIDTETEDCEYIEWTNDFRQKFGIGISEKIPISNEFCELIGIWIAEGSINKNHNQVSFTIHKKEEALKKRIISLMWQVFQLDNVCITTRKASKAVSISYSSSQLAQFLFELFDNTGEWKDKRADNTYHYLTQWDKRVPCKLRHISPQKQLQIVKGWFLGDGYASDPSKPHSCCSKVTTVSKELAKDMLAIFYRNMICPSVDIETRSLTSTGCCDCYNLALYGDFARVLYQIKYQSENLEEELVFPLSARRKEDIPVVYNGKLYMRMKIECVKQPNTQKEQVYCLKMPNANFSVNNVIVHNCRGYRSEQYPDGIDIDVAQYLSSLIPVERGEVWSLEDVLYGNEEKGRKPIKSFINEVSQYEGLIDIMLGIKNLVSKRSSHASGIVFFDKNPYEHCAFMRTPTGEIITQWDLHEVEYMGNTKYDILITNVQDKILNTIKLLQDAGEIDPNLPLREVYNQYLHPNVLPIHDESIWDAIDENRILDLFQFDSDVGSQAAKKIKPRTMQELADSNGLMRLAASERGAEPPMEKYIRYKNNINLWYDEMHRYGLTDEEIKSVQPHFAISYGVPPSQEQLMQMLMDENICGFTLAEANDARKIVAKKQTKRIPELKNKVINKAKSRNLGKYIWECGIKPQATYSFSIIHALAYSFIGVQTAFLATHWNPIYWNTACLIVNSGAEEENNNIYDDELSAKAKQTDYAKIAKALGAILARGIKVSLVDINKSDLSFKPDPENNEILFGMGALSYINAEHIAKIKQYRPYASFKDFLTRCPLQKRPMLSLIKSGAFDKLEGEWGKKLNINPRILIMGYYILTISGQKDKLTLQNYSNLLKNNLIPDEMNKYKALYSFNTYLKSYKKVGEYFVFDENCEKYYNAHFDTDKVEVINGCVCILRKEWDKIYQKAMDGLRDWIKDNQQTLLNHLNMISFKECWNNYAKGTVSSWEMDSLCFYYHEHELAHVNKDKYGITNFSNLPSSPEVSYYWTRGGKNIPIYTIHKIIGTVLSKNDTRASISLLTPDGVVSVKFTKEYYAMFKKRISEAAENGTRTIKEESWFTRGTKLLVQGFRRDDTFIAKTYKNTPGHQLYRITDICGNDIKITHERYQTEDDINV